MSGHATNRRPSSSRSEASTSPRDRGAPEDVTFDSIYPLPIQVVSRRFWTPVGVARRAAQLFRQAGARNVLDVGSGVGKFVFVAAASEPEVCFVGIDHRENLVEVARRAHV